MVEALTFGNVEADTMAYLEPLVLVDVERVLSDPLPPGPFVRVLLTGGRRINLSLIEHRVTLECWGGTGTDADSQAFTLGQSTYGHMGAWRTDSIWVPEGENAFVGSPYADVDPDTKRPRYVMTANVRQAVTHL